MLKLNKLDINFIKIQTAKSGGIHVLHISALKSISTKNNKAIQ
jgi:hypothetical protein